MARAHLFVDTNIFLHFRPIKEINWPEVANVDSIEIVIPRVTVRELDLQKNKSSSPKIRERARRTLQDIEEWLAAPPTEIAPNTRVVGFAALPDFPLNEKGLKEGWADDELVAAILTFEKQNPGDVLLVTDDTGIRLTARACEIKAIRPPEEARLPVDLDDETKRVRRLEGELARLRAAAPILSLRLRSGLGEGSGRLEPILRRPPRRPEKAIREAIEGLRAKFPGRGPSIFPGTDHLNALHALGPSEKEYDRYNRERLAYFAEYESYLERRWRDEVAGAVSFSLAPILINEGGAPGEDIDIAVHVPDGIAVRDAKRKLERVEEPQPPMLPRDAVQMAFGQSLRPVDLGSMLSGIPLGPPVAGPPANVSRPKITPTGSYTIDSHVGRLKHGSEVEVFECILTYEDARKPFSFHCGYVIRAANFPDPIEGQFHVVVPEAYPGRGGERT